jgi:hypothetical protein
VIPLSTTWKRRSRTAVGIAARIALAAAACSAWTRARYAFDEELVVSSRVGPSEAKNPGPLASARGGSCNVAITVMRPERCACGT